MRQPARLVVALLVAGDLAIGSITVRPADPVVGPVESVKLVIDVVARGAETVQVVVDRARPGASTSLVAATSSSAEATSGPADAATGTPEATPGAGSTASPSPRWETWRFLPPKPLSRQYPSGAYTVTATARDARGQTVTAHTTFLLRRATEIAGFTVKRARDGKVRITGTLLRVDPQGQVDYRPFAGQRVAVRFRPAGRTGWRTVTTVVTRRDGWFRARLPAADTGHWRAEYRGSATEAGTVTPVTSVTRRRAR